VIQKLNNSALSLATEFVFFERKAGFMKEIDNSETLEIIYIIYFMSDICMLWYVDDFQDWCVGSVADRGANGRWISADNQGSTCPFAITSTNWDLWYNSQWNSGSGVSFTCSQAKILNVDVHGVNSSLPLESATQN